MSIALFPMISILEIAWVITLMLVLSFRHFLLAGTLLCALPFLVGDKTKYEGTWGDQGELTTHRSSKTHLCLQSHA